MGRLFVYVLVVLLSIFTTFGCGRKADQKSKVSLSLGSSNGSQSENNITFIAINISGGGVQKTLFHWESHDACFNCAIMPSPPTSFELETPYSLEERLIQVLVVFEDKTTNVMTFYYGDLATTLPAGYSMVSVLTNYIATTSGNEGNIVGRYKLPNGSYYTGDIIVSFNPPNGASPMDVFEFEMFSGWMSLFILQDIGFQYLLPPSPLSPESQPYMLFGGAVSLTSAPFTDNSHILSITTPTFYKDHNQDGIVDNVERSRKRIFGYWDAGILNESKTVCRDNTTLNFQYLFIDNPPTTGAVWPTHFNYNVSNQTCTASDPIVSVDSINVPGELFKNGDDSLLFEGPFMRFKPNAQSYYGTLHTNHDATQNVLNLSWKYLPEMASHIGGVSVLYNKNWMTVNGSDHLGRGPFGINCYALRDQMGFTEIKIADPTIETFQIPGVYSTELNQTKVVLCPLRGDGGFFRTAIESHCLSGCGGGSAANGIGILSHTLNGATSSDFGASVTSGTVIGQDSLLDLIVGAPSANSGQGKILVYNGNNLSGTPLECVASGSVGLGTSVAVGDVDTGNGMDAEILVGSYQGVYLFKIDSTPSCIMLTSFYHGSWSASPKIVAMSELSQNYSGYEMIVGDPMNPNGGNQRGWVSILRYTGSSFMNVGDLVGVNATDGARCGSAIGVGAHISQGWVDLNDDGGNDIIIGCPGIDKVKIFYAGGAISDFSTLSSANVQITGPNSTSFGSSLLVTNHDVVADLRKLLVVGAPLDNSSTGLISTYSIDTVGATIATFRWSRSGENAGDQFGFSLTQFYDASGDYKDDIAVGVPGKNSATGEVVIVASRTFASYTEGSIVRRQGGIISNSYFGEVIHHQPGWGNFFVGSPEGSGGVLRIFDLGY